MMLSGHLNSSDGSVACHAVRLRDLPAPVPLIVGVLLIHRPAAATSTADTSGAITIDGTINDGSEWGGSTFPLYGRPDYIFEYKNGSKYLRGGIDVANVVAATTAASRSSSRA